jgi:hypothetical protein
MDIEPGYRKSVFQRHHLPLRNTETKVADHGENAWRHWNRRWRSGGLHVIPVGWDTRD